MVGHFPIALRLQGRDCLVVGGGVIALRKVGGVLECGAQVRVVAPKVVAELGQLSAAGALTWIKREFEDGDIGDAFLIIAATNDRKLNARIGRLADQAYRLVNVVDQPEDCNFIMPAVHRAGALTLSVTTDGKSPALAARIKQELENQYPASVYGPLLEWLGELRSWILANEADSGRRRELLIKLANSELPQLIQMRQMDEAVRLVEEIVGEVAGCGATSLWEGIRSGSKFCLLSETLKSQVTIDEVIEKSIF